VFRRVVFIVVVRLLVIGIGMFRNEGLFMPFIFDLAISRREN
jgi:hypothetical protein